MEGWSGKHFIVEKQWLRDLLNCREDIRATLKQLDKLTSEAEILVASKENLEMLLSQLPKE